MMRTTLAALVLSLSTACTSSGGDLPFQFEPHPDAALPPDGPRRTDAADAGGPCALPTRTVRYTAQIQPIWDNFCGCHSMAARPPNGFSLAAGMAHENLLRPVMGAGCAGRLRVVAGQPDQSFVVDKTNGQATGGGPLCTGQAMPLGEPELAAADKALLRTWIAEGACPD
jgi:hypothetical protein